MRRSASSFDHLGRVTMPTLFVRWWPHVAASAKGELADPLHGAWVNAKALGNAVRTLAGALNGRFQRRLDALLQIGLTAAGTALA
jgi:hypothetical protein